jgi:YHS domain-containing protein
MLIVSALGAFALLAVAAVACSGGAPSAAAPTTPEAQADAPSSFAAPPPVGTRATCPVMKEAFVVGAETLRSEHDGKHYVFCCPDCKAKFDADPEAYLR